MIYSRWTIAGILAIIFVSTTWMGVIIGVSSDSVAETQIDVDEEVSSVGSDDLDEPRERVGRAQLGPLYSLVESVPRIRTPLDPYLEAGSEAFVKAALRLAFGWFNSVATFSFYYLQWMPTEVIQWAAKISVYGMTLGVFAFEALRVKRLLSEGAIHR